MALPQREIEKLQYNRLMADLTERVELLREQRARGQALVDALSPEDRAAVLAWARETFSCEEWD